MEGRLRNPLRQARSVAGIWMLVVLVLAPAAAHDLAASATVASPTAAVHATRQAAREAATDDVVKATVARVDSVGTHTPGLRLAGYRVRPDTERPLTAELLRELLALVRAPQGFDDGVRKRCRPGVSLGFRLARRESDGATGPPPSELVIDFGCNRLSLGDDRIADVDARASYFDPSRAAFVGLARRALPDDPEIARLR